MQPIIVAILLAVAVIGLPLGLWLRSRWVRKDSTIRSKAVQFALDNYARLIQPHLNVITEPRLRLALKTATNDEAELLQYLIKNINSVGHVIDSFEDVVIAPGGMGFPPMSQRVQDFIYGISESDLRRAGARKKAR